MDTATRLKRHTQLWSARETSARRIGIGGSIFALIIVLSVIEPYHIESGTRNEIEKQESEVKKFKKELDDISEVEKQLGDMADKIEKQLWTNRLEKLKDDFKAGRITQPRTQSNDVLDAIATELEKEIVAPLRAATAQLPDNNELSKVPDELDALIEKWLKEFKAVSWWDTVQRKNETVKAIADELQEILDKASTNASSAKKEIESKAKIKTDALESARKTVDALTTNLQKVMDRALPAWARGVLSVDQLLVLFPWLLAGLAIYLVVTAWQASHHFHAMADGEGWSAEERRDPLLSSAWTLTPRGTFGSAATFATYGSVLGVLGACLYRSLHPPTSVAAGSVQASVDAVAAQASMSAIVAYGFFIAAMAAVVAALLRDRQRSEEETP